MIKRRLKGIAAAHIFIAGLIRPSLLRLHLAHVAALLSEELIDRRDLVGFADVDIPGRIIVKLIIRLELGQENILRLGIIADVFATQSQRHRKTRRGLPCVRGVQALAGAVCVNPKRFICREKAIGAFARKREA